MSCRGARNDGRNGRRDGAPRAVTRPAKRGVLKDGDGPALQEDAKSTGHRSWTGRSSGSPEVRIVFLMVAGSSRTGNPHDGRWTRVSSDRDVRHRKDIRVAVRR